MLDKVVVYGQVALLVLGGVTAGLAVLAPLTKSDVDNKLLDVFRKLATVLGSLIGAKAASKPAP